MSGRAEFLDQLADETSSNAAADSWLLRRPDARDNADPHNWALDVVDNGDNTNYVALARARSRAIASRVHDLHHVFTAYRRLLVDEASAQADAGVGGPTPGDDDDEAQLFSALAQSVMQMSEDVQHAGRTTARSRRRAKLGTTQEARETEEQFDSLVDLLAKQATKLTDDLDAIVLLAQARIDRADADAQDLIGQMRDTSRSELAALRSEAAHQVRMLLDLHAVRARHTKTLRRSFTGWQDKACRLAQRKRRLAQATQRLPKLATLHAWNEWVEYVHEQRLESAYALHATAVESASTQLRLQHERIVEQSYWRAQTKSETRLLQATMTAWITYTANCVSLRVAIKRMQQRLGSMLALQVLRRWALMVEDVRAARKEAAHRAELSDAENTLGLQKAASARHAVQRSLRSHVGLAFDAWHWFAQSAKRLELTRLRTVSRLGALYQSRAWQQWVAVVDETRVTRLRAEHDSFVAELEDQLQAQREQIVNQAKRRSLAREAAQRMTKCFSGWVDFTTRRRRQQYIHNRVTVRKRANMLYAAVDAWHSQASYSNNLSLTMRRVMHQIATMRTSRAWTLWLAVVDSGKAQRRQVEHNAAIDLVEMKLSQQRDTCATQTLLRQQRKCMAICLAAWARYSGVRTQLRKVMTKVVVRINGMILAAAFDAWDQIVENVRCVELTRLRAISRIAGLYQERAWQQWVAVVDEAKIARERVEHMNVVQSVGAAMMLQWEAYVRTSHTRARRRVLSACFCGWADLMAKSANLKSIKHQVVRRRSLIRLSSIIFVWNEFTSIRKWQQLKRLRVVKRLSGMLLARAWRLWLVMVHDQRLEAEQHAHTATVAAANATTQQKHSRAVARSTARMKSRRRLVVLNDSLQQWVGWRDLVLARREITRRVVARTDAIYLRMVMRIWCLATEESAKNRERLEYTAVIDEAEDILATQWETTVRHYLSRMERLRQQRCFKFWVGWAMQRANQKNIMMRVRSRLEAMRCAASFVTWQALTSRSVWSTHVCTRAVSRLRDCLLRDAFVHWVSLIRMHKRAQKVLSIMQRSFIASYLIAWKDVAMELRNARKVQHCRMAVESAENLCLAQFHRSIRLLTERCAKRRALRWLSATWVHWERYVETSRREKMQAKAEFDLQEMQRQAELLVELRVELTESHREQAQLCHEAEISARREKAAAEAHFVVEQERSEQVQAVSLVRDQVLGLRQELSEREKDLAEVSKRETALVEQRQLAERSRQEAQRRAELQHSELLDMQRQVDTERNLQDQSTLAAQAELSRVQGRELAEVSRLRNEVSQLRKHQADETAEQERRVAAAAAVERNKQTAAMKTMHDEISRMQNVFQAAGTPLARTPQQPSDTHDVSFIANVLRSTTETAEEELQRRAESVASLRAQLFEAQAEAHQRSEAEAEARKEAQAKAKAMIAQASDAASLQLAAQEIVARVESVAHGEPTATITGSASADSSGAQSRGRRGSWLLVQSPESQSSVHHYASPAAAAVASPPLRSQSHSLSPQQQLPQQQQRSGLGTHLSPEDATSAVATARQAGGVQIQFSQDLRTPQQQRPEAYTANTVQRGAGSWRAYEKEADELNAQAKIDARRRVAAEKQVQQMEAKLAQMHAMLADDASDRSSQGGID